MSAALAPLRPDLRLMRGPPDWDGSATATLHDPLRNRFYRLGWRERALLANWRLGSAEAVAQAAARELGGAVEPAEVERLAAFLAAHELVERPRLAPRPKPGLWHRVLHSYLFFRVPLVSPERFVAATQPRLDAFLGARWFPAALALLAAWALIQTLRQWDVFLATLPPLANAGGLATYGAMLVVSAVVHELGHAYAARRAGCRVGKMGVAFMVLVPTLYTDVTEAWALPDRRRRLAIGLAGVAAEGLLALLALALWPLLPEGAVRSALVALVTTSLATTLVINLNPLMRFDGYYLLSDLFETPNLQARAFALWTWRLRRTLFGIQAPPPETPPRSVATLLSVWAWCAIPWRAAVYLGIALLVYHAVFKLAGIALFAVEIGWFLVRPCWSELKAWWSLRAAMRPRRLALTGGVLLALLAAALVPWGGSVELGAVLEAERHARLYAPVPARLAALHVRPGARVAEGEPLVEFEAPELQARLKENAVNLDLARWQVDHLVAQGSERERILVERQALAGLEAERAGLLDQAARLRLVAPFAGEVVEVEPSLAPGRWLSAAERLGAMVDPGACRVVAYTEEQELGRLRPGAKARFYPDDPELAPVPAVLATLDASAATRLDDALFHAEHGGAVAIRHDATRPVPAAAIFRLRLDAHPGATCRTRLRGHVRIEAAGESVASSLWRRSIGAALAESGL